MSVKRNDEKADFSLNPYEYTILNDFELYSVHPESAEIERWFIFSTKVDYVKYNRKALDTNRVKFNPTEERWV